MRLAALAVAFILLASTSFAFKISQSRDELLIYYQTYVQEKIPKTAKLLIGDEKLNVYIAGRVFGIQTKYGDLYSFEEVALEKPGIVVKVSDDAAEKIAKKQMGVMQAIESGGIKIEAKSFLAALKVEAAKRIYAVSGADEKLLGKRK
ncbi:MAG: hypothetical protein QW568_05050 [Candidatus Anstonellaceae archaeon]